MKLSTEFAQSHSEELRDACGVFACILADAVEDVDVANVVYSGLIALQHRGQESAGMVTANGKDDNFKLFRDRGLVTSIFHPEDMARLGSGARLGIGHTRYSTAGLKDSINCIQPFVVYTAQGTIAVSHNGELVGAKSKREMLLRKGVGLSTDVDSELIAQMLAWSAANHGKPNSDWLDWVELMVNGLNTTSFSLAIMVKNRIFAVRDPWGNRPLCIGELRNKSDACGWIIASESTAFFSVGARYVCEVKPGEIVEITPQGISNRRRVHNPSRTSAFCIFEYVYFAKADSIFEGQQVYQVRFNCGRQLGIEAKAPADLVSTVPDSATPASLGYAAATGIPYMDVFAKNNYVGRTFIQPNTKMRQQSVSKKFSPICQNFKNKSVVLIDDSIVRGNTIQQLIKLLRDYGAREVHVRIASPPIKHPCYMGINIPTKEELLANCVPPDQISSFLGADSVVHLSLDGLKNAVRENMENGRNSGHCTACLDGIYPVALDW